jgi:hypothetical protein
MLRGLKVSHHSFYKKIMTSFEYLTDYFINSINQINKYKQISQKSFIIHSFIITHYSLFIHLFIVF